MKTLCFLTLTVIAVVLTRTSGTKQSFPIFNQCLWNPCKNGGQCIRKGFFFVCKCRPGYTGRNCQIRVNPCHKRPCKNGGVCMRLGNGFHCKCRPGYTGQNCQTYCKRAVADIVFVLDESGSITHRNFEIIKKFVKNLISIFPISRTQVRVGVITFSTYIKNEFNLNRYFTHRQLYYAINRIRYSNGATNTHLALNYLKRHAFQSRAGGRKLIPQIAIVITDGRSTHPKLTRDTARILKHSGIQVYAIGIGKQVPRSELVTIASNPSKEYIYGINSFRDLTKIKSSIASKTCLGALFQQDNAKPHTARKTSNNIEELDGVKVLLQPAYSPDVAPSDYGLFRSMQHFMKGY
ncbi:matrilin-2 [Octopus sinensis]|uniref:Matrilin-2 n=1 Tax=Octopus sinensis TaxID=2607531 RepID=A0A6P7U627_9MOLL|nr:matrilin-2 [Octopus sinensis]